MTTPIVRRRAFVEVAALLLAVIAAPPSAGAQGVSIDLEQSGVDYPVFRIPALAVTTRGTLLAAYDGRPTGGDLPSHIAVLLRRSTDGGKSWLPRQVVRADTAPLGFGDPSLLVDGKTGRIFLFYAAGVKQGFFGSATGTSETDPNVLQADYSWSDDDGKGWQHRRITSSLKQPEWAGLFAASGAGIQLQHGPHAGRLIQQYVVRYLGNNYAASAWSDDHGDSWQMGELVGPGVDENKVVELADGRVMLNGRAKGHRKVAYSSDGGAHYGEVHDDSALVDPGNNAAIIRFDAKAAAYDARAHWLLFSNTADSAKRVNLTLRLSCDDGATWPARQAIEPGASGYSTLAMMPDGRVGVLYERGNYQWISFAAFDLQAMSASCR